MSLFEHLLKERPQDLLLPDDELKQAALQAVKDSLDPLAPKYSIFKNLHIEGLDAELVWAQARMIIDGAVDKLLESEIPPLLKRKAESDLEEEDQSDGDEEDLAEEEDFDEIDSNDDETGGVDNMGADEFSEFDGLEDEGLDELELDRSESEEETGDEQADDSDDSQKHPELDTGLFRLKDFQKQILQLENRTAEDDGIDYFAEQPGEDSDESENGENLRFEDFFARPRGNKGNRVTQRKMHFDDTPRGGDDDELDLEDEEQLEQAMGAARKDLFNDYSDEDAGDQNQENLSTFEKQQLEILRQIHQLEQENVAEKEWQVKGEVKAKSRPLDSLIETELDFDRNAKPVPVITEEVTQTLEDMIRKRIKNDEFDDLPRRLPDSLPEFKPSRKIELQETKSQKSLAELYEEDHLRKENPDVYERAEDEKMNDSHKEIVSLFTSISRKLDALSSWNYTPKAPKPSLSIVMNTSAISMEEAQPVALASESTLGPQEVYTAAASSKRELVGPDGLPVAKSEMTREERHRERRRVKAKRGRILREKEETQKAKAHKENSRAAVLETLKKANVTVIGKKGEKRDISGNLKKDARTLVASNLKL
jgi:U3 small nucleolar RNA-associated protein MPP10